MSYTNADGLRLLTRGDQGVTRDGGATESGSLVVEFDLAELGTAITAADIDPYEAFIPAGAVITGGVLVVTEAATSGGTPTLTIGTYDAAGAAIDADGIDAAVALTAIDGTGDVVRVDGAQVAGVGGYFAANGYVKAVGSAGFTGGKATLVLDFVKIK